MSGIENRRAKRKPVNFAAPVLDVINGKTVGQLGNLSATGMLVIGTDEPRTQAIYQLRFPLPGVGDGSAVIEAGVQEQWHDRGGPGQFWAGYRIIAISDDDAIQLEQWLELPD